MDPSHLYGIRIFLTPIMDSRSPSEILFEKVFPSYLLFIRSVLQVGGVIFISVIFCISGLYSLLDRNFLPKLVETIFPVYWVAVFVVVACLCKQSETFSFAVNKRGVCHSAILEAAISFVVAEFSTSCMSDYVQQFQLLAIHAAKDIVRLIEGVVASITAGIRLVAGVVADFPVPEKSLFTSYVYNRSVGHFVNFWKHRLQRFSFFF